MLLAALLAACAHGPPAPEKPAQTTAQLTPEDEAQADVGLAQMSAARARAAESGAVAQLEVARGEQVVAGAQLRRNQSERDLLAKRSASPEAIERCEEDLRGAQQRLTSGEAKTRWLGQLITLRQTEREAAEAHLSAAQAEAEQVSRNARHADSGDAGQRAAESHEQEARLQERAADQRAVAEELHREWQDQSGSAP
jgi:hypothetical protein